MEERKRTIFVVIIALVLMIALLYSFGPSLFSRVPQLELANPNATATAEPGTDPFGDGAGVLVEVTPETVQDVIASVSRYESYSRTLTITYTWGDENVSVLTAKVWEDSGWKRTALVLPSGIIENSIVGEGQLWLWYDDGSEIVPEKIFRGIAAEVNSDLFQRIPTYEDILLLEPSQITSAEYLDYNGQPSIYVEAENVELGYLYRYWISETNGLLMATETEKALEIRPIVPTLTMAMIAAIIPAITILAPHLAKLFAIARPMPRSAPVIKTFFPLKSKLIFDIINHQQFILSVLSTQIQNIFNSFSCIKNDLLVILFIYCIVFGKHPVAARSQYIINSCKW